MYHTFYGCKSLTVAPVIPDSVIDIKDAFSCCTRFKEKVKNELLINVNGQSEDEAYVYGTVSFDGHKVEFVYFYKKDYLEFSDIPNPIPNEIRGYMECIKTEVLSKITSDQTFLLYQKNIDFYENM